MSDSEHYDRSFIEFLELMWGEGYLSPGGKEEVQRVLEGVAVQGKTVLDIGCGSGGITVSLVKDFGAARVVGIDVEESVCSFANQRVMAADVVDHVEIIQVTPGPIPLADESFDVVFSKDSIVHIPDKATLAKDVFRLLKPGGCFAASDWLISHDGDPSPEMCRYIEAEDLGFGMASPSVYKQALQAAGFVDVNLRNRNPWYKAVAKEEVRRLKEDVRSDAIRLLGESTYRQQLKVWESMLVVLDSGEHCPHHLRGYRPS